MSDQDVFLFHEGHADAEHHQKRWIVLIVDDEPEVHQVTRLALDGFKFRGRELEMISAHSAKEAIELLKKHQDTALIFMDVVMENDQAGLECVKYIRSEMRNHFVRIILRTGQPGQSPEHDVILNYDINDYKSKTELTVTKLFTCVVTALRSYEDLIKLEENRQGLEKIIRSFSEMFEVKSLESFLSGILIQINALLKLDKFNSFSSSFISLGSVQEGVIIAGSGDFEPYTGLRVREVVAPDLLQDLKKVASGKQMISGKDYAVFCMKGEQEIESLIYLQSDEFGGGNFISDKDKRLVEDFLDNIAIAYKNFHNFKHFNSNIQPR